MNPFSTFEFNTSAFFFYYLLLIFYVQTFRRQNVNTITLALTRCQLIMISSTELTTQLLTPLVIMSYL